MIGCHLENNRDISGAYENSIIGRGKSIICQGLKVARYTLTNDATSPDMHLSVVFHTCIIVTQTMITVKVHI